MKRKQSLSAGRAYSMVLAIASYLGATACSAAAAQEVPAVTVPAYDGVEQVLVLSDRWVIVVTSNIAEVLGEIDALSNGQLKRASEGWEKTKNSEKKDWTSKRAADKLREQYIAEARVRAGEAALDSASSYSISSADDVRYGSPRAPAQVGRVLVGIGAARSAGAPEVDYVHYSYIGLPWPMESGRSYTVAVEGKKRATFLFDEDQTVSRAIKVNQVGYLSDASQKFAYLGCHLYEIGAMDCSMYPRFEVVRASDGAVALEGPITLRDKNARIIPKAKKGETPGGPPLITGEDVYELDLGELKEPGNYYIRIPGVGRSWPFRLGDDVYGETFYTSARGLYHQRCGVAYDPAHTSWKRAKCHQAPVYETDYVAFAYGEFDVPKPYNVFDIYAATMDKTKATEHVWGGWHDAADWDRRNQHYTVLFDLLNAYEIAPKNFVDGQLNLPESGNGIPDILDEAAFGLEVWAKSMTPEGGVSGHVETIGHVTMNSDAPYAFSRRTRWDSLLFAAAAAQLAEHLKPVAAEASERWAGLARKAYDFGNNPANSLGKVEIAAKADRGRGAPYTVSWEEKDSYLIPFLLMAKSRMFWLTGDRQFLDGVKEGLEAGPAPYAWPFTLMDYSPWIYFSLCYRADSFIPEAQRKELMKKRLMPQADKLLGYLDGGPYRQTWPRDQDYYMGFGLSDMTNAGRALLIAHALTGESKYRDAAILNFDFMLGANPMGMSWTTGLGQAYPVNIQHEVSMTDGIDDPVPGITVYGITGAMYAALRNTVWNSPAGPGSKDLIAFKVPEVPVWRRWSCHPTLNVAQCEFTVQETMSSTIFCSALLLSEGWRPPAELLERAPRPKASLYGYYYLP
jgi:endoglucanase